MSEYLEGLSECCCCCPPPPMILGFSLEKRDDPVHFDAKPNKNQKSLTKVFGSVRFDSWRFIVDLNILTEPNR